jgi:hypothetical protein
MITQMVVHIVAQNVKNQAHGKLRQILLNDRSRPILSHLTSNLLITSLIDSIRAQQGGSKNERDSLAGKPPVKPLD